MSETARIYRTKEEISDAKAKFLDRLMVDGNVTRAARYVKVNKRQLYYWKASDAQFAKEWVECTAIGIQALEDEATRRGYQGVKTPITVAGEREIVRKYSDTLLLARLKSELPKYREHTTVDMNAVVTDQSRPFASLLDRITALQSDGIEKNGNGKHEGNGSE